MWDHKLVFARYGFKLLSRLISHKDPKFAKKVLDEGCIDKFTKHLSDSDPSILTEIFNSFAHLIKSIFQNHNIFRQLLHRQRLWFSE